MTRQPAVGRGFRTRKLSNKQNLQIVRENQIDAAEDDGQRNIPQIETGVERGEEIELHLQEAIANSVGSAKKAFIPTPNTAGLSAELYERLYPQRFTQPASYIRFSTTVEECNGASYCMSAADEAFLAKANASKPPELPAITESDFEAVMDFYECTIQQRQPFLHTDVSHILSYKELVEAADAPLTGIQKRIAELIYAHWKSERLARKGPPIIPALKFEQGSEKDDGDPYVCFRRRELRQVRRTRGRDAQSMDKLRKLRQEMETAIGMMKDVVQREGMRKTTFVLESQCFEGRQTLIQVKRKLGIKGDDEDLFTKPKRSRQEQPQPLPRIPVRLPVEVKIPDADLRQLTQVQAEEERKRINQFNHLADLYTLKRDSREFYEEDFTMDALYGSTKSTPTGTDGGYCNVRTYFIPSPTPSWESSDEPDRKRRRLDSSSPERERGDVLSGQPPTVAIIQTSLKKPVGTPTRGFRRRKGRGGRTILDRTIVGARDQPGMFDSINEITLDRLQYDEKPEMEDTIFVADPHSDMQLQFRAQMLSPPPDTNHPLAHTQPPRRIMNGHDQQLVSPAPHRPVQYSPYGANGVSLNGYRVPRTQLLNNGPVPQVMVNGHVSPPATASQPWV